MIITYDRHLPEVAIIQPDIFKDRRGEYIETWNARAYKSLCPDPFVQDDISVSHRHVFRGLHGDTKTWKLIQCLYGKLYLVVVDWRESSSTYKVVVSFGLDDKTRTQVLIPPHYLNGHLCISKKCIFHYKQTTYYEGADAQFTVAYDDPRLSIHLPIAGKPVLSERDGII